MTEKRTVHLPRPLVNQLLHLAQQSPEKEICGLIGSREREATCYPIDNVAVDASVLFALNASEQIAAMKSMRERNQELFAIYHSHPTASALPSVTDITEANYPDALYLIISLNTRGVLEMRGFYLGDNSMNEVALSI
ncbi:MAG: hypothetical protein DRQ47_00515 [Gammaproteobacteria bacterium]|nr:MAG: hypothetical protein DRQ47_00515 [Gammaproteobacteria bacterium]